MGGWVDGWIGGWVGGWVDGWMGGWMHACNHNARAHLTAIIVVAIKSFLMLGTSVCTFSVHVCWTH